MSTEFETDENGRIRTSARPRIVIESYSPGIMLCCPKCNSSSVLIFFGDDFLPRLKGEWKEKIRAKLTKMEDRWEEIQKLTLKDHITSQSNPNWICKNCYDGGIIV